MSNVYEQEPPTTGKLLLYTTYGPIEIELWCKECPKATRNFIQLCLEGYYDQTTFHRLVPGFVIQGGDPTGTGNGGSAVDNQIIPPEYHTRLKWTRRGLLGVAGMDSTGNGKSQFFFTLCETPELYRKSTLFGKVVGETIYNLVRMGELQVEKGTERILHPPIILYTQVLNNPFDDIIPRELLEVKERREKSTTTTTSSSSSILSSNPQATTKIKLPPTTTVTPPFLVKNRKVLSFGEGEEEEEGKGSDKGKTTSGIDFKIKSSHEILNDPSLCRQSLKLDLTSRQAQPILTNNDTIIIMKKSNLDVKASLEELQQMRSNNIKEIQDQITFVQQELKGMNDSVVTFDNHSNSKQSLSESATRADSLAQLLGVKKTCSSTPLSQNLLKEQLQAYKERKKTIIGKRGRTMADEMDTLLALNSFREKLKVVEEGGRVDPTTLPKKETPTPASTLEICKLHGLVGCESCRDTFGGKLQKEGTEDGWLMHRLVFDKDAGYREMRSDLDSLAVIDPRDRQKSKQNGH